MESLADVRGRIDLLRREILTSEVSEADTRTDRHVAIQLMKVLAHLELARLECEDEV